MPRLRARCYPCAPDVLPSLKTSAGSTHNFDFQIRLARDGYIAPVEFLGCTIDSGTPRATQVFTISDGCANGPVRLLLDKIYNVRVIAISAEIGVERALLQFRFSFSQEGLPSLFGICRKLEVPFYRPGFEAVKSQGPYVPPPRHEIPAQKVVKGVPPPGRIGNKARAIPKLEMPKSILVRVPCF